MRLSLSLLLLLLPSSLQFTPPPIPRPTFSLSADTAPPSDDLAPSPSFFSTPAAAALLPLPLLSLGGALLSPHPEYTLAPLLLIHLTSTYLTQQTCTIKNIDPTVPLLKTLLLGPFETARVATLPDEQERQLAKMRLLPPLQSELSTLKLRADGISPEAVLLTFSLTAKPGMEYKVRGLLEDVCKAAEKDKDVLSCVANQDGEGRVDFMMLQRFRTEAAMRVFQNTREFRLFARKTEALLTGPMGMYCVNERNGVMGVPVNPFGPGGEGGREDAIYSSPTNLQGSGGGGMG